jgi:hypothetical protein
MMVEDVSLCAAMSGLFVSVANLSRWAPQGIGEINHQASLRWVAGLCIVTQNAGDLRKSPVVLCGVLHHVARDKANVAAINPISYPNCRGRRLLFLCNHQLQFAKAHNHVLLQHFTANLVLLARMALATHRRPYNLDENIAWMDGLVEQQGHRRRSRHRRKGVVGFFSAGACAAAPSMSTPTREVGVGAAVGAGAASGWRVFFWRL